MGQDEKQPGAHQRTGKQQQHRRIHPDRIQIMQGSAVGSGNDAGADAEVEHNRIGIKLNPAPFEENSPQIISSVAGSRRRRLPGRSKHPQLN